MAYVVHTALRTTPGVAPYNLSSHRPLHVNLFSCRLLEAREDRSLTLFELVNVNKGSGTDPSVEHAAPPLRSPRMLHSVRACIGFGADTGLPVVVITPLVIAPLVVFPLVVLPLVVPIIVIVEVNIDVEASTAR